MHYTKLFKQYILRPFSFKRKLQRGFSLVEMIVVIVIIGIISAIALPAFDGYILSNKLQTYSFGLLSAAKLARSEAIKSHEVVRLCASSDGVSCTGSWKDGWIVINASDKVLHQHESTDTAYKITDSGGLTILNFEPTGIGATQAALTICRQTPVGSNERVVNISVTGRSKISKKTQGTCP